MSPLVKFIYYLSVVFFLGILFYSYYQFPEFVAVGYSHNTGMKEYIGREALFYYGAGAFFLFNVLLSILKFLLPSTPFRFLFFPNRDFWLSSIELREALQRVITVWLDSFGALFNLLTGFVLLSLFFVNVVGFRDFSFFLPFIYFGIALVSLWFLVLIGRLSYKKEEL